MDEYLQLRFKGILINFDSPVPILLTIKMFGIKQNGLLTRKNLVSYLSERELNQIL